MKRAATSRLPLPIVAAGLLLATAWIAWLGMAHLSGRGTVLDRAEASLSDLRLQVAGPRQASDDVAIVVIDDATVSAAGGYPLDRRTLAALVGAIADRGARALAMDLLLVDPGDGDEELAAALARIPTVIAAAGQFAREAAPSAVPRPSSVLLPQPKFAAVARVGLVNVATDAGGTPRHVPLLYLTPSGPMPSFVLRAVGAFVGEEPRLSSDAIDIRGQRRALDLAWHVPIRFLGESGVVTTLSASHLLADRSTGVELHGRLVFLGATATGVGDRFSTPFDPVLPGVEVLATAASNLLDGGGLVRDPGIRRADVAATAVLTAVGAILVVAAPLVAGLSAFAVMMLVWMATTVVLFAHGFWLSAALPLAGAIPPVAVLATARELHDRRVARAIALSEQELSRLQAPALARRIAIDPDFLLEPVERSLAVLFIDLAGFTGLSESLGPVETRRALKSFHTFVVEAADAHGGVVMSFMGDGAMIVHGVPDIRPDDAAQALDLAFALEDGTERWIMSNGFQDRVSGLRAGLHFGPVVVSRLGHDNHQHITATGDSVNVASRLMEVAKSHGASIAASSALLGRIGPENRHSGPETTLSVDIRGRREPLDVALWKRAGARPASSVT